MTRSKLSLRQLCQSVYQALIANNVGLSTSLRLAVSLDRLTGLSGHFMKSYFQSSSLLIAFLFYAIVSPAFAELKYSEDRTDDGIRYVVVSGEFDHSDDLSKFVEIIKSHNPVAVIFNSPGGNLAKAMEFGRLVRSSGLDTIQFRGVECESACALAFMGGVTRTANTGAIGVHKSSFSGDHTVDAQVAVSAVQQITADIITYMIEMGVDPSVLQIALQYESDDMRYLSRSEMEQYGVVATGTNRENTQTSSQRMSPLPAPESEVKSSNQSTFDDVLAIPVARSGRVRHPNGEVFLKSEPDIDSGDIGRLINGSQVSIFERLDRWYRVRVETQSGYLHHSWVLVDQFAGAFTEQRYIQIRSYHELDDALSFVRSAPVPLSAFLSVNGWIAVTFKDTYDRSTALKLLKSYKAKNAVPKDSFVTYGNTYVRKV